MQLVRSAEETGPLVALGVAATATEGHEPPDLPVPTALPARLAAIRAPTPDSAPGDPRRSS